MKNGYLTWVEVSKSALNHNIKIFRELLGDNVILCPCVKSNAYGHGLVEVAKTYLESGANWLSVNSIYEAEKLRQAKIKSPIYIMGYVDFENLEKVVDLNCRIVMYNIETIEKLNQIAKKKNKEVPIHVKIESGLNRQGVLDKDLDEFIRKVREMECIKLEGVCSHLANVEDVTNHEYAKNQLKRFKLSVEKMEKEYGSIPIKHIANSAATLLFNDMHFEMVRPGIASYGLWPSKETYISWLEKTGYEIELKPAFSWKAKIAQIKEIPAGEYIGYGCAFKSSHKMRIAVIPVGYYDGYDRGINNGYVLVKGRRAAVLGRIAMNIIVIDVTNFPELEVEDEVVLLGQGEKENVSADDIATWAGTINYEITTRVNEMIPRIMVE
ncbi:alanine racemase [Patescibacteria group bacterium]